MIEDEATGAFHEQSQQDQKEETFGETSHVGLFKIAWAWYGQQTCSSPFLTVVDGPQQGARRFHLSLFKFSKNHLRWKI